MPTIGTLFFLNFVAAVVIAAGLVGPLGRVAGRHADLVRAGFAVAGIGLAVLSLVALFISESSSLFNFTENGYRTANRAHDHRGGRRHGVPRQLPRAQWPSSRRLTDDSIIRAA